MRAYNLEDRGSNFTKLFCVTYHKAETTIWYYFWGPAPRKIGRAKNVQN